MRETVIAEALGEPHQGRGLDARVLGDARDGAEGHLLRVRQREGRQLLQPLRHRLAPAEQQRAETFVIVRDGVDRHFRAVRHGVGLLSPYFACKSGP